MDFTPSEVNPVFRDMLEQLQKVAENIPKTQQRMLDITGVAWSDDRMVKVVVGPRGQLVDLEIDPRVFRKPDAEELKRKILSTSAAAVAKVTGQVREIMDEQLPADIGELRNQHQPEREDDLPQLMRSDAEIFAERKEEQ